ncbi:HAD family hydrolase [Cognatishimia sp. WU-CL00825]|uniref:HAD-IA family hydrolase n=1 Tax=Cognatishimia sp. WU-CL00825 TaxID=3127658 RepID=UPI003108DA01
MTDLRLVVFDVDGTLVDSQGDIIAAMTLAFEGQGLTMPPRNQVLAQVGLSLEVIFPRLVPDGTQALFDSLVQGYKDAYMHLRKAKGSVQSSPLYPGALDVLGSLNALPDTLLGVATGKSRRGLDKLLEAHGLTRTFVTEQVADFHPSKPHPAMLHAALSDTGVAQDRAVMVGDTSFDMEMAKAAGLYAIGVSWGYHKPDQLHQADVVIHEFNQLHDVLNKFWG